MLFRSLVERALLQVLPSVEEFPYAIRVVSEILSSNGSSSMASTCGSTLALMDAGVPIKAPVSGIAMGLVSREEEDGTKKIRSSRSTTAPSSRSGSCAWRRSGPSTCTAHF